jgi:hypothetical protein
VDPAQAVKTRQAVLAFLAERAIPIAGAHIAAPGMGYIRTAENNTGYDFLPLE